LTQSRTQLRTIFATQHSIQLIMWWRHLQWSVLAPGCQSAVGTLL